MVRNLGGSDVEEEDAQDVKGTIRSEAGQGAK